MFSAMARVLFARTGERGLFLIEAPIVGKRDDAIVSGSIAECSAQFVCQTPFRVALFWRDNQGWLAERVRCERSTEFHEHEGT
jgi:hypothetical protein